MEGESRLEKVGTFGLGLVVVAGIFVLGAHMRPGPAIRVSSGAHAELHAALELILERAPSAVISNVTEVLTKYAGRFGEEH